MQLIKINMQLIKINMQLIKINMLAINIAKSLSKKCQFRMSFQKRRQNRKTPLFSRTKPLTQQQKAKVKPLQEIKKQFKKYQIKGNSKKYNFANDTSRNFIEQMCRTIQKQAVDIIDGIIGKTFSKQQLYSKIEHYLNYSNKHSQRSLNGMLTLMVVVKSEDDGHLNDYATKIIQFLLRSQQFLHFKISAPMIAPFIYYVRLLLKSCSQKTKYYSLKYMTQNTLKANFELVKWHDIPEILRLLGILVNDKHKFNMEDFRYTHVVNLIQQKLHLAMQQINAGRSTLQSQEYSELVEKGIFWTIMPLYEVFGLAKPEFAPTLSKFICGKLLEHCQLQNIKRIAPYHLYQRFIVFRMFPSNLLDGNNQYYKDQIKKRYNSIFTQIISQIPSFDYNAFVNFFSSYFIFEFSKVGMELDYKFLEVDGVGVNYIPEDQHIRLPQMPEVMWLAYHRDSQSVNLREIYSNIIRRHYPSKYINSRESLYTNKPTQLNQNQTKIRISQALNSLKIKYQDEVAISGRYTDFYLPDHNVILEIDGDVHYRFREMQMNDRTHFRNVHFLLDGHKLILLNIYEYTLNRSISKLAEIIRVKLKVMEEEKAKFVL